MEDFTGAKVDAGDRIAWVTSLKGTPCIMTGRVVSTSSDRLGIELDNCSTELPPQSRLFRSCGHRHFIKLA